MQLVTFDFETLPILPRPDYPPAPVGLALHADGMEARYISWGHVSGRNNGTEAEAKELLWRIWCDPSAQMLAHNAKFDLAVAGERWGFPSLPWHRVHDTTFLAFLADPHSRSAGLKQLCEDLLGMPPDERDAVAEWVIGHKRQLEAQWPSYPTVTKKAAGAWIFAAPAELVEPYAIGDVVRARALYDHLMPLITRHGMEPAYDRERQVLPILMENERRGMRVDLERLEADCELYGKAFAYVEDWLRRELHASGLNFDSDDDTAQVLIKRGVVPEENFERTKTGKPSMSKENLLPEKFTGPNGAAVASMLGYRNRLKTCLTMFMEPWRNQAQRYGAHITTNWNQIRGYGDGGTRTGRPSTNGHNFLNISKSFEGRDDQYQHPETINGVLSGLPKLPLCRKYILPDDGDVFLHRDFSGQELRVFGHFEQGALWDQYQADPRVDVHNFVGDELKATSGRDIDRTSIKVMNFQAIYGGGVPALQKKLRCSTAEAKALKQFHDQALPGRRILNEEIERIIRRGEPIRTLGGRLYFEEPRGLDGRSKIYKLINYLVQGSAADLTKQALIDWYSHPDRVARFLVTVYDEINLSAPVELAVEQMALLRETMETPRLTVPMLSDGKWGWGWGDLAKYDDASPDFGQLMETRHAA